MIKQVTENGIVHTYSDAGRKIQQKGTHFPVNNAYEPVGRQHEWEEVIEENKEVSPE